MYSKITKNIRQSKRIGIIARLANMNFQKWFYNRLNWIVEWAKTLSMNFNVSVTFIAVVRTP